MDTERLNQWMTLIANIGVIIGVVILAIEIRLTRDAVISATYQARAAAVQEWDWNLAESTNVSEAIMNFDQSRDQNVLSEIDQFRLNQINLATFNRLDNFYYQYELGLVSQEMYEHAFHAEMTVQIPRMVSANLFEHPYVKLALRPSFRLEIEKYLDGGLFIN